MSEERRIDCGHQFKYYEPTGEKNKFEVHCCLCHYTRIMDLNDTDREKPSREHDLPKEKFLLMKEG